MGSTPMACFLTQYETGIFSLILFISGGDMGFLRNRVYPVYAGNHKLMYMCSTPTARFTVVSPLSLLFTALPVPGTTKVNCGEGKSTKTGSLAI